MYRLPASTSSREHQLNVHRPTCAFAFVLTLSDRRWTSSCPRKWSSWDRRLTHFSLSLRAWIKSHTGSVSPQVCHPKYSDKPGARSRGPGPRIPVGLCASVPDLRPKHGGWLRPRKRHHLTFEIPVGNQWAEYSGGTFAPPPPFPHPSHCKPGTSYDTLFISNTAVREAFEAPSSTNRALSSFSHTFTMCDARSTCACSNKSVKTIMPSLM